MNDMENSVADFLDRHRLEPTLIDPRREAEAAAGNMRAAIGGKIIDIPMIKTYLSPKGKVPDGGKAVVIDAGGTNYRCALASFFGGKCRLEDSFSCIMPGVSSPCTWESFIAFAADSIEPYMAAADKIGFCFSYGAEITESRDAIVRTLEKEVAISGCDGKLLGASLLQELEKRNIYGKKVVVLNDTAAALLGGLSGVNTDNYSDVIGMICGTGFNCCCVADGMIINTESGSYKGIRGGDIDEMIDKASLRPGEDIMEKMISGGYIGQVFLKAVEAAASEGIISFRTLLRLKTAGKIDGAVVDAFSGGNDPMRIFAGRDELDFAVCLSSAILERSALCACTAILAVMLMNGSGKDKPVCVFAEGSLVGKSRHYLDFLNKALDRFIKEESGLKCHIIVGHDTTLPGAGFAALTD